jgi:hypothetical protein
MLGAGVIFRGAMLTIALERVMKELAATYGVCYTSSYPPFLISGKDIKQENRTPL